MTIYEIRGVLARIDYKEWLFRVEEDAGGRIFLQVQFYATDNVTGELERQHGRKWILSPHMTKSEVVQTALKAVLAAEEHEAREQFTYRGRAIFGPHFDVDALWEVAETQDRRARA